MLQFIESHSIPEPNSGCHLWLGSMTAAGYGRLWDNGRMVYAHRFVYELTNGAIPVGAHILHHCDNPACCNPDHLYAGTHTNNMADAGRRGRFPHGARHYRAKLTEQQVKEIRTAVGTHSEIASKYNIGRRYVSAIKAKQKWVHLS